MCTWIAQINHGHISCYAILNRLNLNGCRSIQIEMVKFYKPKWLMMHWDINMGLSWSCLLDRYTYTWPQRKIINTQISGHYCHHYGNFEFFMVGSIIGSHGCVWVWKYVTGQFNRKQNLEFELLLLLSWVATCEGESAVNNMSI